MLDRNDYEGALAHLERGKALAPGNAEVQMLIDKAEVAVRGRRRTRDLTGVLEAIEAALARHDYRAAEMRLYQAEASFGEQEVFSRLHERLGELRRRDLEARRRAERLVAAVREIEAAFARGDLDEGDRLLDAAAASFGEEPEIAAFRVRLAELRQAARRPLARPARAACAGARGRSRGRPGGGPGSPELDPESATARALESGHGRAGPAGGSGTASRDRRRPRRRSGGRRDRGRWEAAARGPRSGGALQEAARQAELWSLGTRRPELADELEASVAGARIEARRSGAAGRGRREARRRDRGPAGAGEGAAGRRRSGRRARGSRGAGLAPGRRGTAIALDRRWPRESRPRRRRREEAERAARPAAAIAAIEARLAAGDLPRGRRAPRRDPLVLRRAGDLPRPARSPGRSAARGSRGRDRGLPGAGPGAA